MKQTIIAFFMNTNVTYDRYTEKVFDPGDPEQGTRMKMEEKIMRVITCYMNTYTAVAYTTGCSTL